jgi:hypothetical protein
MSSVLNGTSVVSSLSFSFGPNFSPRQTRHSSGSSGSAACGVPGMEMELAEQPVRAKKKM